VLPRQVDGDAEHTGDDGGARAEVEVADAGDGFLVSGTTPLATQECSNCKEEAALHREEEARRHDQDARILDPRRSGNQSRL
jgi:hypothetical protein